MTSDLVCYARRICFMVSLEKRRGEGAKRAHMQTGLREHQVCSARKRTFLVMKTAALVGAMRDWAGAAGVDDSSLDELADHLDSILDDSGGLVVKCGDLRRIEELLKDIGDNILQRGVVSEENERLLREVDYSEEFRALQK